MARILVVDDEESICWGLRQLSEGLGHQVETVSSAEEALDVSAQFRPQLIMLDVRLPGMDGLTALERFREQLDDVAIIVMTAYGDLTTAVSAVRGGAFEYVIKPFELDKIERAMTRALLSREVADVNEQAQAAPGTLVGRSEALQNVFKHIALAAASEAGVLLFGESGTGKELAARAIHQYSEQATGPFVAVNVASLSATLAESELFGHVQGSFTGADQDRVGLLVQANGGTLFLDEVADIPLPVQVKLLRALEHGEVMPVGSTQAVESKFRVVSATHQDLLRMIKAGTFRHDLYFRLGAFRIDIPPLRERLEDLPDLALHFLAMLSPGDANPVLSPATLKELEERPWYGNVRELRNALEHAVIVARGGIIEPDHLPAPMPESLLAAPDAETPLPELIASLVRRWSQARLDDAADANDIYEQLLALVEPPLFQAALEKNQGQFAAAARRLGMHRTTLRKKLDQYALKDE